MPDRDRPKTSEHYRHWKGKEYLILGVSVPEFENPLSCALLFYSALHTETLEVLDVYYPDIDDDNLAICKIDDRALTEEFVLYKASSQREAKVWARPLENFLGIVADTTSIGSNFYRFVRIKGAAQKR